MLLKAGGVLAAKGLWQGFLPRLASLHNEFVSVIGTGGLPLSAERYKAKLKLNGDQPPCQQGLSARRSAASPGTPGVDVPNIKWLQCSEIKSAGERGGLCPHHCLPADDTGIVQESQRELLTMRDRGQLQG